MTDQMEKVTGKSAPEDYIKTVKDLVTKEYGVEGVNRVIAYFSGAKYNVEVDVIVGRHMSGEELLKVESRVQVMLEDLPDVERAYVHVSIFYCLVLFVLSVCIFC